MAHLTDEDLEEFKKQCEKMGIKFDTETEYRVEARKLRTLAEILFDTAVEDLEREDRLKKEPKGWKLEGEGRSCSLCHRSIGGDMWFDKWGFKCMDCQQAYWDKIIPGYTFKDSRNEKHVTVVTLSVYSELPTTTIRKLVRQGKIKARTVPGNGTLVILYKENPDLVAVIQEAQAARSPAKNKPSTT